MLGPLSCDIGSYIKYKYKIIPISLTWDSEYDGPTSFS